MWLPLKYNLTSGFLVFARLAAKFQFSYIVFPLESSTFQSRKRVLQ